MAAARVAVVKEAAAVCVCVRVYVERADRPDLPPLPYALVDTRHFDIISEYVTLLGTLKVPTFMFVSATK